jgi:iron complex outermembrane receptor protein
MTGRGETLRGREPLYTLNGVSQSTPLRDGSRDGHSIDVDFLERVEVVHGSNAMQGIGATGGVINMVTRQPNEDGQWMNEARLAVTTGDGLEGDGVGSKISWLTGRRIGRTSFVAGVALNQRGLLYDAAGSAVGLYPTQGDIMDSRSRNLFANVAVDLNAAQRVSLMVTDFHLERDGDFVAVPGNRASGQLATTVAGDPRPSVGDPARNTSRSATLEYRHRHLGAGELTAQAYLHDFAARFEGGTFGNFYRLTPDGPPFLDQSEIESDKVGVKLTYDIPARRLHGWRTTVGLDLTQDRTAQLLARSGRQWVPRTTLRETSPFVQVQRALGTRLLVTGGLRAEFARLIVGDYITIAANNAVDVAGGRPGFSDLLPNVGAVYQLGGGWSTYASLSQGFTMPDAGRVLRDVNIPGLDVDQLLDVQPVVADNREIGLDYHRGGVRAHMAYYRSHSDLGSLLVADATRTFSVRRQPTRTQGVDLVLEVSPRDNLTLGSTYAWQAGQFDSTGDGRPDTDLDGINIGPNRLNVFGVARVGPRVSTRLQVSTLFARDFTGPAARPALFGGYTTADFMASIDTAVGVVRVGVENALNRQYVTYFSQVEPFAANDTFFAGPGRTFTFSLQRRF